MTGEIACILFVWRYYGAQFLVDGSLLYNLRDLPRFLPLDEHSHLVVVLQSALGQVGGSYDHLLPVNHYHFGVHPPIRLFKVSQHKIPFPELVVQSGVQSPRQQCIGVRQMRRHVILRPRVQCYPDRRVSEIVLLRCPRTMGQRHLVRYG